jgi:hypothetical protein
MNRDSDCWGTEEEGRSEEVKRRHGEGEAMVEKEKE